MPDEGQGHGRELPDGACAPREKRPQRARGDQCGAGRGVEPHRDHRAACARGQRLALLGEIAREQPVAGHHGQRPGKGPPQPGPTRQTPPQARSAEVHQQTDGDRQRERPEQVQGAGVQGQSPGAALRVEGIHQGEQRGAPGEPRGQAAGGAGGGAPTAAFRARL